jgi:hypothetical protein
MHVGLPVHGARCLEAQCIQGLLFRQAGLSQQGSRAGKEVVRQSGSQTVKPSHKQPRAECQMAKGFISDQAFTGLAGTQLLLLASMPAVLHRRTELCNHDPMGTKLACW